MDRSWIYKSLPFDPVYIAGVDQFMQHVRSRFRADDKIKCPCHQCLNRKEKSQVDVEEDIHINGFCRWYTSWIHHGEVDGEIQDENDQPPLDEDLLWDENDQLHDENEQPPLHDEGLAQDVIEDSERGVAGLVQDLHTAASHGFGGNLYKQILEEAKRELYPGCTEESRLSFIIKLLHIKVYNQITNSGFDAFLELLSNALKNVPGLPKSYSEVKALLRKLGFGYEKIDVCKYDCALFWDDHAKDQHCPVCGFTRWKVNK